MAVVSYPGTAGYARWHAWRQHSSEVSPYLESGFLPAALAIPVRPQGVLLWRGQFETPVYGPSDARWASMRDLMEEVDEGINSLRLPVPADQIRAGVLGELIVVQPVRIDAPVRGSRGETRGWGVEWVEDPAGNAIRGWEIVGSAPIDIVSTVVVGGVARSYCNARMNDPVPASSMADGDPGQLSTIRLGATTSGDGVARTGVVRANFGLAGRGGMPDSLTASARNALVVSATLNGRTVTADNFDADATDPHDAPGHTLAQTIANTAQPGDIMTYRVSSSG